MFLIKLAFFKPIATRQVARWTPIFIQQNLQSDSVKNKFFGVLGYKDYHKQYREYLQRLRLQHIYRIPTERVPGLSNLRN